VTNWDTFCRDLKTEIWGTPVFVRDTFYESKFERIEDRSAPGGYRHEVRADWSFSKFIAMRCEDIPKTPSPALLAETPRRIPSDVRSEILRRINEGETKKVLAEEYGIAPGAIRYWQRVA
jgi:hypothetical protein